MWEGLGFMVDDEGRRKKGRRERRFDEDFLEGRERSRSRVAQCRVQPVNPASKPQATQRHTSEDCQGTFVFLSTVLFGGRVWGFCCTRTTVTAPDTQGCRAVLHTRCGKFL
jgi:hypothetical protein